MNEIPLWVILQIQFFSFLGTMLTLMVGIVLNLRSIDKFTATMSAEIASLGVEMRSRFTDVTKRIEDTRGLIR